MTSASAPSSEASQDDSPPAAACRHRARNRLRTTASNAASRPYQRSRPASRQNARISSGIMSRASVTNRLALVHSGGRGLLFIPQLAAQDLADIGLRQGGPELDLLRHLVVRQLGAAELDDVLGGEARV